MRAPSELVSESTLDQSSKIALVLRNSAFVLVALVYFADPAATLAGWGLFGISLGWGAYRVSSRGTAGWLTAIDVGLVLVLALAEPLVISPTIADLTVGACRLVAYPAIVALAIAERPLRSLFAAGLIVAATGVGDQFLLGAVSPTVLILATNWLAAAWVRRNVVRAAKATDGAQKSARAEHRREQISAARIRFEREQLATLHDTAASTLLMVADQAVTDESGLARQAARDIIALTEASMVARSAGSSTLADVLQQVCDQSAVSVRFHYLAEVAVSPLVVRAVTSAAREALNNVARHSGADSATVELRANTVTVIDRGRGFDLAAPQGGFGLSRSITERMRAAGGEARVTSAPGEGTTVELTWEDAGESVPTSIADSAAIADSSERVTRGYQYGLAIGAVVVTAEALPLMSDIAIKQFPGILGQPLRCWEPPAWRPWRWREGMFGGCAGF